MTRPDSYVQYSDEDRERFHGESQDPDDERSDFERDRSRILHSAAFRRQGGKTQAFPTGQSDFFRNRLTHALEVAQIAKGLALRLGADTDLCEAAALAHDIGHPPFGHSGEDVLESLMASHGGFEANAQNYRVVCLLEKKAPDHEGLDLSRATLDALFKYKSPISPRNKKGYYVDDNLLLDTFKWICDGTDEQSFECQ
ncbi:MAG: dNTP triphosphohydrolase, partial [Dehalococcoidia bacterium]